MDDPLVGEALELVGHRLLAGADLLGDVARGELTGGVDGVQDPQSVVMADTAAADLVGSPVAFHAISGLQRDGAEALTHLAGLGADLVVLDVLMPVLDGVTVCRRLRESGDRTPVLMLTARDSVSDRVVGLDAGADDYLTKPFALEELLARVRALLRRSHPEHQGPVRAGDLALDLATRQVARGDRVVELTRTEFALLELLIRNAGVLTRDAIRERVWGFDDSYGSNTLAVYIGYLRRKTEEGGGARMIHTVRGVGFVLRSS